MDEAADKSWPWCLRVLLARPTYHVLPKDVFFRRTPASAPDAHRSHLGFGVLHILEQTQPMCDDACDSTREVDWQTRCYTTERGTLMLSQRGRVKLGARIRQEGSRKASKASCQGRNPEQ